MKDFPIVLCYMWPNDTCWDKIVHQIHLLKGHQVVYLFATQQNQKRHLQITKDEFHYQTTIFIHVQKQKIKHLKKLGMGNQFTTTTKVIPIGEVRYMNYTALLNSAKNQTIRKNHFINFQQKKYMHLISFIMLILRIWSLGLTNSKASSCSESCSHLYILSRSYH